MFSRGIIIHQAPFAFHNSDPSQVDANSCRERPVIVPSHLQCSPVCLQWLQVLSRQYKIFQRMFPNVTILFNIEASFANLLQHQMYLGAYKQYPFQLNEYKLSLSLHIIINVAEEYNPNRRRRSGAITMLTLSLSRPPDPLFLPSLICAKP